MPSLSRDGVPDNGGQKCRRPFWPGTHRVEYELFIQLKLEIFFYEAHVSSGVACQLLGAENPQVKTSLQVPFHFVVLYF